MQQTYRCAVYTRKSSEEGLDQEFNSLDAQREACVAYIASQAGLGWKLVPDIYDDGGISGSTMERPALQRLLQNIRNRRVDVVVVYKIDRLTRSLMDFSRIVEIFDASSVSFVSVTQAFNTTTSMGRLTLNVLLSFAQFEREVTAERIRDKIAASKKKGMWMGGRVPLGYHVEARKLLVREHEAEIVRGLFARYLELKSVRRLVEDAKARGLTARSHGGRDGKEEMTNPFGRGNLYHLLANPIYIGKIRHRELVYPGEHAAILDQDTFDRAQTLLASQAPSRRTNTNDADRHLLTGLLVDETGVKIRSVHASKNGKRYRYYVSRDLAEGRRNGPGGWRLPARELDAIVAQQVERFLSNPAQLAEWIQDLTMPDRIAAAVKRAREILVEWRNAVVEMRREVLDKMVHRICLEPGHLSIEVNRLSLSLLLESRTEESVPTETNQLVSIDVPISLKRRGVETRVVLTDGQLPQREADPALVGLIGRASFFLSQLTDGSGKTLTELAQACNSGLSEVSRVLPLAFLSPKLIQSLLDGTSPVELNTQHLLRLADLPVSWSKQATALRASP